VSSHLWQINIVVVLYDLFCRVACFLELLCDDDISPFIDVLDNFHAVDVVELWMIDDYLPMIDYIDISTKDIARSVFTFIIQS